jgi:hypothetical protein
MLRNQQAPWQVNPSDAKFRSDRVTRFKWAKIKGESHQMGKGRFFLSQDSGRSSKMGKPK